MALEPRMWPRWLWIPASSLSQLAKELLLSLDKVKWGSGQSHSNAAQCLAAVSRGHRQVERCSAAPSNLKANKHYLAVPDSGFEALEVLGPGLWDPKDLTVPWKTSGHYVQHNILHWLLTVVCFLVIFTRLQDSLINFLVSIQTGSFTTTCSYKYLLFSY